MINSDTTPSPIKQSNNTTLTAKFKKMESKDDHLLVAASPQVKRGEKKCFVKVVAIGDSGVGKTSLIQMEEN